MEEDSSPPRDTFPDCISVWGYVLIFYTFCLLCLVQYGRKNTNIFIHGIAFIVITYISVLVCLVKGFFCTLLKSQALL